MLRRTSILLAQSLIQPYHFYVISNQEIKDKIQAVGWNQPQFSTCSHLIVFAARKDLMANNDEYFTLMTSGNPEARANMKGFEDMLKGAIAMHEQAGDEWATKQTYIAHGFAMAACAELEIDSCPMEGFDPVAVGEILGLPETQKPVVMLPIGYRAEGEAPRGPKVRFSREALFTEVK
jgi:nitroreductase